MHTGDLSQALFTSPSIRIDWGEALIYHPFVFWVTNWGRGLLPLATYNEVAVVGTQDEVPSLDLPLLCFLKGESGKGILL
ncbi:hypothetical protein CRG98_044287 [Punica granatum]|uniref:Uncharacterized protein n=1 Tax=Punica granatum TaxID=22663 RepID=A0A2I0HUD6_PUNGR|nr:hypothetical protein CRG98_044287 [Punica granatum]